MTNDNRNTFDKYIHKVRSTLWIDGTVEFVCQDEEEYKKLLDVLKSVGFMIRAVNSFRHAPINVDKRNE